MLHKRSPSLHLGDVLSPLKSTEDEQSAVLMFNARTQNVYVGQIQGYSKYCSQFNGVVTLEVIYTDATTPAI